MSARWLVTAILLVAGFNAGVPGAQISLSASEIGAKSHEPRPAEARPESGEDASAVQFESIRIASLHQGIEFEINTSGPVKPKVMTIGYPNRLVMDFPNTVSVNSENHIPVDRDGVKAVRIGVQGGHPPTTRVVVDLLRPRNYRLVSEGSKLILKLDESLAADYPAPRDANSEGVQAKAGSEKETAAVNSPKPLLRAEGGADPTGSAPSQSPAVDHARPAAPPEAKSSKVVTPQELLPSSSSGQAAGQLPAAAVSTSVPVTQPAATRVAAKPATQDDPPAVPSASIAPAQTAVATGGKTQPPHLSLAQTPVRTADATPPRTELAPLKTTVSQASAGTPSDQYVIGEQDELTIIVWKERELSGTVTVRPDGKITLPLVNEIKVVGMTPAQLQAELTEKLKPFVNIPQVTVEVNQINSRKVYLIGEVQKTGSFPVNSSTTVLQVIAEAGGLRDFAKRKDIYILRNEGGKQVRYPFSYDDVIRGKKPQQNIWVHPGDLIVVP